MEVIDHGVCRLALVSVRMDPSDQSEQVTQLLFGDHYEVTLVSDNKKWVRIRIHADLCEGWVDQKQHHSILNNSELEIGTMLPIKMVSGFFL